MQLLQTFDIAAMIKQDGNDVLIIPEFLPKKIIDFKRNNLELVINSDSYRGTLTKNELIKKLGMNINPQIILKYVLKIHIYSWIAIV